MDPRPPGPPSPETIPPSPPSPLPAPATRGGPTTKDGSREPTANTEIRPPAWAIRKGSRLTPEEFHAAFTDHALRASRITKAETWQTYQEPATRSLQEYLTGNLDAVGPLLETEADLDETVYTRFRQLGTLFLRLRVVRRPLTPYLTYEMENYRVRARRGERIQIADRTGDSQPPPNHRCFDFLLLDDTAAFVHDYGETGLLAGGWLTTHPIALAGLGRIATTISRRAVPLDTFLSLPGIRSPSPPASNDPTPRGPSR